MEPVLYIIMRKDIADMNPGKACAQAAHAQAQFTSTFEAIKRYNSPADESLLNFYEKWAGDRGFGTTVVLEGTKIDIEYITDASNQVGRWADYVIDPTYPYRNYYGELFTAPELTCGWVFYWDKNEHDPDLEKVGSYIKSLPLHR